MRRKPRQATGHSFARTKAKRIAFVLLVALLLLLVIGFVLIMHAVELLDAVTSRLFRRIDG